MHGVNRKDIGKMNARKDEQGKEEYKLWSRRLDRDLGNLPEWICWLY